MNPKEITNLCFVINAKSHKLEEVYSKVVLREFGHSGTIMELDKSYARLLPNKPVFELTNFASKAYLKIEMDICNSVTLQGYIGTE